MLTLLAAETPHLSVSAKDVRLEGQVLVSPLAADELHDGTLSECIVTSPFLFGQRPTP